MLVTMLVLFGDIWLVGLLAERHDNSEPTLDNEELLPGTDPFSPPDDPHTEVEQDDDDDDTMPTNNMSSLDKSLQVTMVTVIIMYLIVTAVGNTGLTGTTQSYLSYGGQEFGS